MDQRSRYLETRINSASPGELLLMLYDGLIQRAQQAGALLSAAPAAEFRGEAAELISRCIDILTELNTSLQHDVDPALCSTLSDLYQFHAREFSAALDEGKSTRIDAILPLIIDLRETWREAGRLAAHSPSLAQW